MHKIVSVDKILQFTNVLIIIIHSTTTVSLLQGLMGVRTGVCVNLVAEIPVWFKVLLQNERVATITGHTGNFNYLKQLTHSLI